MYDISTLETTAYFSNYATVILNNNIVQDSNE